MRLTNANIERVYRRYNRKYFGNRLPTLEIKFASIPDSERALGYLHYEAYRPQYIRLDNCLRGWPNMVRMTLLHEMCHVKLPYRVEHGPKFDREMRRLARLGAFTGLW